MCLARQLNLAICQNERNPVLITSLMKHFFETTFLISCCTAGRIGHLLGNNREYNTICESSTAYSALIFPLTPVKWIDEE